jgi:hypothetical protein
MHQIHICQFLLIIAAPIPQLTVSAKQRPWLGPSMFYGNPPSPRQLHGFAGTLELYVFGGQSSSGGTIFCAALKWVELVEEIKLYLWKSI